MTPDAKGTNFNIPEDEIVRQKTDPTYLMAKRRYVEQESQSARLLLSEGRLLHRAEVFKGVFKGSEHQALARKLATELMSERLDHREDLIAQLLPDFAVCVLCFSASQCAFMAVSEAANDLRPAKIISSRSSSRTSTSPPPLSFASRPKASRRKMALSTSSMSLLVRCPLTSQVQSHSVTQAQRASTLPTRHAILSSVATLLRLLPMTGEMGPSLTSAWLSQDIVRFTLTLSTYS